ncbi:transcriptional regulator [Pseudonocardia sp. C8]|uniref:transcriptional regulator n=1 Tax=Pseudonocardia sp. C8 TaxID=2762759 RepID=UPI00164280CF|nr:transcriptional regulator [Pseudonocardia sp. C8]MBC3189520.1 transcriptional regulator [Pseudonocardia sp. C8]
MVDKLDHLARTVHPEGRGPYTLDETVAGIRALGGSVSRANLNALRLGRGTNPSKSTLEAIARFYRVSPAYLLDDSPYDEITAEEHELLLIVRQGQLHGLVRAIGRLQPETRQALERVVADLHAMHTTEHPDHET